jgi:hypothetical protein
MEINFTEIIKNGKIYDPAYKHYDTHNAFAYNVDDDYENINVICDRCSESHLPICYGYNEDDLCIRCVKTIIKRKSKHFEPEFLKELKASLVKISVKLLKSDIGRENKGYDSIRTKMAQKMYKK